MNVNITDEYIEASLKLISLVIKERHFKDYQEFEDVVAKTITLYTPRVDEWLNTITIGIFGILAELRNIIREFSSCTIGG
jgi:hypothetical protein